MHACQGHDVRQAYMDGRMQQGSIDARHRPRQRRRRTACVRDFARACRERNQSIKAQRHGKQRAHHNERAYVHACLATGTGVRTYDGRPWPMEQWPAIGTLAAARASRVRCMHAGRQLASPEGAVGTCSHACMHACMYYTTTNTTTRDVQSSGFDGVHQHAAATVAAATQQLQATAAITLVWLQCNASRVHARGCSMSGEGNSIQTRIVFRYVRL